MDEYLHFALTPADGIDPEECNHERTRISHSDSGGKDREYWECLDCGENEEL